MSTTAESAQKELTQRDHITQADIWRLVVGAFIFGTTVGILITPVLDAFLRTNP